jgi:hypothetical protein
MKMRSAVAFVLVALFVATSVAVIAPGTVYAPKVPKTPTLDARFCKDTLGGTWTGKTTTCTINYGVTSDVTSGFQIPSKATLVIVGTLNIGSADIADIVTIANYGTINIIFTGAVNSGIINIRSDDIIANYGTIANDGTVNNAGSIYNCGGTISGSGIITGNSVINGCPS